MLAATILVPTHDHGPTLLRSVPSALAQTVTDIEVLVVGDGVPDVTREVMSELATDERVKFLDNPKGERHGEAHRHAALREARGEIVCYLSDDDLWLPDHLEQMRGLLDGRDFAHTLPLSVDTEDRIHHWRVDLELPYYRDLLLGGENRIPLTCGGHTLELYRRLPAGWRPGPHGVPGDLYMWQQILAVPGCRAASGTRPTVLHFPSPDRPGWTIEERLAELDEWTARAADEAWRDQLAQSVLDAVLADDAGLDAEISGREDRLKAQVAQLAEQHDEIVSLHGERSRLNDERERLMDEQERLVSLIGTRERELAMLSSSVTWRLRERLVGLPGGLSRPIRWAARALAPRGASSVEGSPRLARKREASSTATESPAPDRPSDSPARHSGPSTR